MERAEQRATADAVPLVAGPTNDVPLAAETGDVAHLGIWSRGAIRAVDLTIAILTLILLSPFLLVIALAIRLTSPGPALLRQTRVGLHRTPFVMLKFRTMQWDNDDSAHRAFVRAEMTGGEPEAREEPRLHKLGADPRVTPLGAHLRRLSVDELPQLINVVLGQMSLVGPRPALPWEVPLYEPWHYVRFEAKPGITGLWQVSGRSHLSMRDALALDADYIAHRSLGLDLTIILRTVPKVLSRRGAY